MASKHRERSANSPICLTQMMRGATRLYAMHVSEVASVERGVRLALELGEAGLFIQHIDQPAWRNMPRKSGDRDGQQTS